MARHLVELITRIKPKRALFTTYTFNAPFFDAAFLPKLNANKAGCEISVLVDARQLAESSEASYSEQVGIRYVVAPVIAPGGGVFHPKLAYLESDTEAYLCVGSSNLTVAGQCLQLECWDVIELAQAPGTRWQFIQFMDDLGKATQSKSARAAAVLQKEVRRLKQTHHPVLLGPQEPRLVHTLTTSAKRQLVDEFGRRVQGCARLTVLSPFHTLGGYPVKRLAQDLKASELCLAHDGVAPFDQGAFAAKDCLFVAPKVPGKSRQAGRLHAKVFEVMGERDCLVMAWYVNATYTSLETSRNVEVSVMRWSSKASPSFDWVPAQPTVFAPAESPEPGASRLLIEAGLRAGLVVEGFARGGDQTLRTASWSLFEAEQTLETGSCVLSDAGMFTIQLSQRVPSPHASLTLEIRVGELAGRTWLNDELALYEAATGVRVDVRLARAMEGVADDGSVAYIINMLALATAAESNPPANESEDRQAPRGQERGPGPGRQKPEGQADDDAPFSYEEWAQGGGLRRRDPNSFSNAQNFLKAVYALLLPEQQRESSPELAGTDEDEEQETQRQSSTNGPCSSAPGSKPGMPLRLEQLLDTALTRVQVAFEEGREMRGIPFLIRAVSAMELSKLQKHWRERTTNFPTWDFQKSFLLWMARLCSYPFDTESRQVHLPMVVALACLAARRVLAPDADKAPFGRLPVLRTLLDRLAGRSLASDELARQAALGLSDDLFTRLDPALVEEAKDCVQLLAQASRLDDALYSLVEACRAGRELDAQAALSFPAVVSVLAGRRGTVAVTVLNERHVAHGGCPVCGEKLHPDDVDRLKYTRAIRHPPTGSPHAAHLLLYPDDTVTMSGLLMKEPQIG